MIASQVRLDHPELDSKFIVRVLDKLPARPAGGEQ
jgi:hypothetical protein